MHFSQTLSVAALAAGAQAASYTVQVANQQGALIFNPNTVTAAVGDTVQYVFNTGNHSVTEADFSSPCMPLSGGFNSGFHPTRAGQTPQDTFTYTVADTNPHWFYCAQGRHCESGMVGVINPPSSGNTIEQFTSAAANVAATVPAPVIEGGVNGTTADSGVTANNGTTNGTATTSTGAAGTTTAPVSFSQQVVTSQTVVTSNGQVQTVAFTATTSVPVTISSQAGVKGQLVGFGAAAAGLAAMFL